jgi:ribosomal protein L34E
MQASTFAAAPMTRPAATTPLSRASLGEVGGGTVEPDRSVQIRTVLPACRPCGTLTEPACSTPDLSRQLAATVTGLLLPCSEVSVGAVASSRAMPGVRSRASPPALLDQLVMYANADHAAEQNHQQAPSEQDPRRPVLDSVLNRFARRTMCRLPSGRVRVAAQHQKPCIGRCPGGNPVRVGVLDQGAYRIGAGPSFRVPSRASPCSGRVPGRGHDLGGHADMHELRRPAARRDRPSAA